MKNGVQDECPAHMTRWHWQHARHWEARKEDSGQLAVQVVIKYFMNLNLFI